MSRMYALRVLYLALAVMLLTAHASAKYRTRRAYMRLMATRPRARPRT